MFIDRNIEIFHVADDATIEEGLRKIALNQRRVIFCLDEAGVLVGVLSDGDFRRQILAHPDMSLLAPIHTIINRTFVSLQFGVLFEEIEAAFSDAITLVPLIDDRGRLIAVARPATKDFWLGDRHVADDAPVMIVAEIGINHNGSLEVAKRLVDAAITAGTDCVKFQMRDLDSLYRNNGVAGDFREDLGPQYTMDLLQRFSLSNDEMFTIFEYCKENGVLPLCTPWDLQSVDVLNDYGIDGFKVASADLTNHDLLRAVTATGRPVILSTGMSQEGEIIESIEVLRSGRAPFALLHCNSTYPTPFRDVQLRYMDRLAELGHCLIGYSGHERGFHVPVAAVARGAKIIEKHITLDKGWEGNDHKVSLLPEEFSMMVHQLREIEEALGTGTTKTITQGEQMNRVNLAKSLVAVTTIPAGQKITQSMIEVRSPGRGLQPNKRSDLIGRPAKRDIEVGDFFFESDLVDEAVFPRDYSFNQPWGLPVRYHDYLALSGRSNPDFLEFHMSYRDLEIEIGDVVADPLHLGLIVHSPDLFRGDHLLNFASEDDESWLRSIGELQRVVDTTRQLGKKFRQVESIPIVVSLGGFSRNHPFDTDDLQRHYSRVALGLEQLDTSGVEILPQTLPPYPWYLGGQLFCNLFVGPQDTAQFVSAQGLRLCVDISHSKLACNHRNESFVEAIELLAPLAAHFHIVDASGIDAEGLQVDEGEVDFSVLGEQLRRLAPEASFIPEIWQGHQNLGEGFWVALDRLEEYL